MIRNKIPSKASDIKITLEVCKLVFTIPSYSLLLILLSPILITVLILPSNYSIIRDVVLFGDDSLVSRLVLLYNLFPLANGYTNTLFTDAMIYVVSLTISANITLLIYHLIEHSLNPRDAVGSTTGYLLSVLGAGCASCGTSLLAGLFSLFGLGSILTILPLDGGEFLIFAFLISALSIYWISDGLRGGTVRGCPIG